MVNIYNEYETKIIVSYCNVIKERIFGENKILRNIYMKNSRDLYLVIY